MTNTSFSRSPKAAISLVNPHLPLPADRRALAGLTVANGAPISTPGLTFTRGFHTKHRRFLHITVKLTGDAADTVDWKLFTRRSNMDDEWAFDTRGQDTIAVSDADNPQANTIELAAGADFVYIELLNFTGGSPASVDVWLGGSDTEADF